MSDEVKKQETKNELTDEMKKEIEDYISKSTEENERKMKFKKLELENAELKKQLATDTTPKKVDEDETNLLEQEFTVSKTKKDEDKKDETNDLSDFI